LKSCPKAGSSKAITAHNTPAQVRAARKFWVDGNNSDFNMSSFRSNLLRFKATDKGCPTPCRGINSAAKLRLFAR
jgi:hypothetical protein